MRSTFVTGGTSGLGCRLLPELVGAGMEVVALVRRHEAVAGVGSLGATAVLGDLLEPGSWRAVAAECDTFVHLAGIRFAPQLVEALDCHQPVIAISSASVANPNHPLSTELKRHEQGVTDMFTASAILRPTMIYGTTHDRNLRYLARFLLRLPKVPIFTGGNRIQPVHVDDVVAAIMEQLRVPRYRVLPVGGPDRVQVWELVDIMASHLGLPRIRLPVPLSPVARLVAVGPVRKLHRSLHAVEMLAYDRTVDLPDHALLGRAPTPLVAGVHRALVAYGLLADHQG